MKYNHIKSFDNYINEGFLSKTLDRYRSGEKRIEERMDSNLYSLNGVDMGLPFLFADDDLEINGERTFDLEELEKYIKEIEKSGWRIPKLEDFKNNIYEDDFRFTIDKKDKSVSMMSEITYDELIFPFGNSVGILRKKAYWFEDNKDDDGQISHLTWEIDRYPNIHLSYPSHTGKLNKHTIRLIKDK